MHDRAAIRDELNPNPLDISEVMGSINVLLDGSVTGVTIREQGRLRWTSSDQL
jgi:type I restriction enzyme R subunit